MVNPSRVEANIVPIMLKKLAKNNFVRPCTNSRCPGCHVSVLLINLRSTTLPRKAVEL